MKKLLLITLVCCILLCGCGRQTPATGTDNSQKETSGAPQDLSKIDSDALFSQRDLEGTYDPADGVPILLNGESASCASSGVAIDGGNITISKGGIYVLSGTLENGTVTVNTDKTEKVQLVLSNTEINSNTFAAIYVIQADKVFLTLAENSKNALSNGGSFNAIDDNNVDAVVFSKDDLTLNGSGSLAIESPTAHGIVSKDELTVTGGDYIITCASHGLTGKDSIAITGANFDIAAGKDGIHAENNDDATAGLVYIRDGIYKIVAEGDGISASAQMQIDGGSFDILCGGGSENAQQQVSDNWGNMGGGGRPGGMGGRPGGMGMNPGFTPAPSISDIETSEEDGSSIKGIKSGSAMVINGGSFTIDTADDALHSNGDFTLNGGTFTIKTGDDGFHSDETLTINNGQVVIQESYEGIEGLCIDMRGGDISIVSSDDGFNAAGGTDQSGFGGNRGDMFGGHSGTSSNSYIYISGGKLFMNASGDGIDANGSLDISGGHITVTGPTSGDTSVLDYDQSGAISGGTFIGTGAYMMAQSLTATGEQGVIGVQVGNQSANTAITLKDHNGNTVITYTPNLPFQIVIFSCPDIVKGQTYTICVGDASGEIEAS